jgi:cysteinyl-tRNA synthetase
MQEVKLYNTLTRKVELLKPLKPGEVSIYTCGITVYSSPHIGNWIPYIYWDILVRTLINTGYKVVRVQNITDVGHLANDESRDDAGEDKMLQSARERGMDEWAVSKMISAECAEQALLLNLLPADKLVSATDLIDEQIQFVQNLEDKGFTYVIEGDGVYFDTSKFPSYGELARLDIDGLRSGARVENVGKKSLTDFAIWKLVLDGDGIWSVV